jgi:hypothetical protein
MSKSPSPLLFRLMLIKMLPLAWLAGLRLGHLDQETCQICLQHRWINQNPFRSIYFAALAMAAEMSTGLPALLYIREQKFNCAMLVTRLEANFHKKAVGRIRFEFEDVGAIHQAVLQAMETGEAVAYTARSIGLDQTGNSVAEMYIHWGFKRRS